jgi:transcriptional regulator with XRE-family HTH domain
MSGRDLAFPTNLKRLRAKHSYRTQKSLDKALQISEGTTSRWEQGTKRPEHDELRMIAAHFKITVDQLLDPDSDLNEQPSVDDPMFGTWHRLVRELLAYYPGRIEIKEINFWAPHGTANLAPGASPDRPAV